jgi:hypothetical protein
MAVNALPITLIQEIRALRQSVDVAPGMKPTPRSKMTPAPKFSLDFRSFSRLVAQEDDTFVVAFAFVHPGCAGGVRGAPTAFPFRAGIARRAPGQVRFRSAGLLFNCQVAGSRGCVCGLELNVNICPGQDGTLRPFGRREDWEGFHANARNGEGREGFVGERSGAMVTVDL